MPFPEKCFYKKDLFALMELSEGNQFQTATVLTIEQKKQTEPFKIIKNQKKYQKPRASPNKLRAAQ